MSVGSKTGRGTARIALRLAACVVSTALLTLPSACVNGISLVPFATISATQNFDLPNFTVVFSIESAVSNPSAVTSVNWVFGDDVGFVPGGLTTTHRYAGDGTYNISAFVFGVDGLIGELNGSVTVIRAEGATAPDPADGATAVDLDTALNWAVGRDSPVQMVYFGTDQAAVGAATMSSAEFRGSQDASSFTPTGLTPDTTYHWRIDQARTAGTTKGVVWRFTTASLPTTIDAPMPADNSASVSVTTVLTWMAGTGVTSHDVYFGESETAVNDADDEDDVFQGNQTETEFDPGDLEPDTEYFWRIDERGPGGMAKGNVLSFTTAVVPETIADPSPADGDNSVMVTDTLSWTAGAGAASHNVYFGTDENAVDDASQSDPSFRGTQTGTTFDPDLDADTTYFWRIDEVGPGGTTKGAVMSFSTISDQAASSPDPEHGEEGVALDQSLTWVAGVDATSHDVFFGTDESAVRDATTSSAEFQGNFPSTSFGPTLESETTYFWRVDEVNDDGVVKGVVWSFTTTQETPEQAEDFSPTDGASDVTLTPSLSWTAGENATSHDVYFGMTMAGVSNATRSSSEFKGNRAGTSFSPGTLARATTYYWRIDEVNDAETTQGDVLSFTTIPAVPTAASNPMPADGATDQNANVPTPGQTDLSWTAGTGVGTITHDVFFGTDETTVLLATTTSNTFMGNQTDTTFDPGELTPFTEYFWRVDERNAGGAKKGVVNSFRTAVAPAKATGPSPATTAVNVALPVTLMWTAGANTTSHDVYFGTSMSNVSSATRSSTQFRSNLPVGTTSFSSGFGLTIEGDTSYFWRIDEVGTGGVTMGTVWEFRTAPQMPDQAGTPSPFNGNTNVATSAVLSWSSASGATMYHVYFGTNQTDVTNGAMSVDQGEQASTSFNPGTMAGSTQYFWRIDTINDAGTTTGVVWTFTTQ